MRILSLLLSPPPHLRKSTNAPSFSSNTFTLILKNNCEVVKLDELDFFSSCVDCPDYVQVFVQYYFYSKVFDVILWIFVEQIKRVHCLFRLMSVISHGITDNFCAKSLDTKTANVVNVLFCTKRVPTHVHKSWITKYMNRPFYDRWVLKTGPAEVLFVSRSLRLVWKLFLTR